MLVVTFRPISPSKAIELVETAGVANARRLIGDYAAAGLVRASAIVIETIEVSGERSETHGEMAKGLWERIVQEGVDEDVWIGGMVRLLPSELIGGAPAVNITGIRFNVMDLHRLIISQRGYPAAEQVAPADALPSASASKILDQPLQAHPARPGKNTRGIRPGALLASVNEAAIALGRGRTTIYKMLGDGRLKRAPGDGTRIEVASIMAVVGRED